MNTEMTNEERYNHMLHIVMKKYALKTGLKKLKERGEASVTNELTNLHVLNVFSPVDATKLATKQRAEDVE